MTTTERVRGRGDLTIALISEVFFDEGGAERLRDLLAEAAGRGADLAILPELPLNPWSPASRARRDDDAEPPQGPRARIQADAARGAAIGLVGGAIVRDPRTGMRHNTALVFDARGALLASYRKSHIPEEPGFWETSHYEAGTEPPRVIEGLPLPIGVQICSDINRPEGSHLLAAMGAALVVAPRATEQVTWPRWRVVFIANALTSCTYFASVNRPRPEAGVLIGGPSIVVGPGGEVMAESTDTLTTATLRRQAITTAQRAYPGYLPVRVDLYAQGWTALAAASGHRVPTPAGHKI